MSLVRIDRSPSLGKLRMFAAIWLGFFGILGGLAWMRQQPAAAAAFWAAATTLPAVGLVAPAVLRAVYVGMACLSFPLGLVVSLAILAAIYYLVITPIGLVMRGFGYDPMHRTPDPSAKSYWVPCDRPGDTSSYLRQF
jgi:fatty acid desaturase